MLGRSSRLLAAALMAGLGSVGSVSDLMPTTFRAPRERIPEGGTPGMKYGMTRRSSGTVAQAKRAALKARNRARNKAVHRG